MVEMWYRNMRGGPGVKVCEMPVIRASPSDGFEMDRNESSGLPRCTPPFLTCVGHAIWQVANTVKPSSRYRVEKRLTLPIIVQKARAWLVSRMHALIAPGRRDKTAMSKNLRTNIHVLRMHKHGESRWISEADDLEGLPETPCGSSCSSEKETGEASRPGPTTVQKLQAGCVLRIKPERARD